MPRGEGVVCWASQGQKAVVLQYLEKLGFVSSPIFLDKGLSVQAILRLVGRGEVLLVGDLWLVGRKPADVVHFLSSAVRKELVVHFVRQEVVIGDKNAPEVVSRNIVGIDKLLRCLSDSEAKRFQSKLQAQYPLIDTLLSTGYSQRQIAKRLGCGRNTLARFLKCRGH